MRIGDTLFFYSCVCFLWTVSGQSWWPFIYFFVIGLLCNFVQDYRKIRENYHDTFREDS